MGVEKRVLVGAMPKAVGFMGGSCPFMHSERTDYVSCVEQPVYTYIV